MVPCLLVCDFLLVPPFPITTYAICGYPYPFLMYVVFVYDWISLGLYFFSISSAGVTEAGFHSEEPS